jgi:hypothetical protein
MICFEILLGIKIKLLETKLCPIHTVGAEFASTFRCKVDQFSLLYLGLLLKDSRLHVADWQFLIDKVDKRLQSWKCQLLSLGGRLTLINYVLLVVPLYTLSIYKVSKQVVKKLDSLRNKFLWQGSDRSSKKYALVKWLRAYLAKNKAGLRVLNFQKMNISLQNKITHGGGCFVVEIS